MMEIISNVCHELQPDPGLAETVGKNIEKKAWID